MKKFLPWLLSVVLMTIILTLTVSIDIPVGNSGRPATFYIGSTLTPWPASASVDYQCDGVDDHIQIQQALDALPVNGGKIVIYAGNYKLGASISRAIDNIVIEGVGAGTYLSNNGVTNIFNVGIQKKWVFKDIRVDNGGISVATASEWSFDNVWIGLGYVAKRSDFTTTQNQDMANKSYVDGAISAIPPSLGNVTGGGLANRIVKWVNSTSIGDASNTDAQVSDSVGKAHMQGTDTSLGTQVSDINMGGKSITNVNLVDGVDISSLTLGNITGSGTIDILPKFGSSTNLIDSSLSSNSTSTYIASNLTFTSGNSIKTNTQDFTIVTGSNKTLVLDTIVYDDLLVPASTAKLGNTHDPGFTVFKTNGIGSQGVYTYWFDSSTEEELFFTAQFPHGMKIGSTIHPHTHWVPAVTADGVPADQKVVWALEYTWADIGQNFPVNTTIITSSDKYPNDLNVIAGKHYYCDFPDIAATAASGQSVSSILVCRLFRKASDLVDNYEHDAGLLAVDFHYEIDTVGSRYETLK